MIHRTAACLAGALLCLSAPLSRAQTRPEPIAARTEVAVAAPAAKGGAVLFDSAPCVGDDDFHRFDGSPLPGAALPRNAPVTRVVIAGPEPARERSRRASDRSR